MLMLSYRFSLRLLDILRGFLTGIVGLVLVDSLSRLIIISLTLLALSAWGVHSCSGDFWWDFIFISPELNLFTLIFSPVRDNYGTIGTPAEMAVLNAPP